MPKQKHSSVERNRLKRRLRELTRTRLLPLLPPVDLVIRTLPEAYDASFAALEREVVKVGERARSMSLPCREAAPEARSTGATGTGETTEKESR